MDVPLMEKYRDSATPTPAAPIIIPLSPVPVLPVSSSILNRNSGVLKVSGILIRKSITLKSVSREISYTLVQVTPLSAEKYSLT